jgi:signal transduction histidine kinase
MSFYQEIAALFNSPAGSIAYHAILGFAILGALYSAFTVWKRRKFPQGYRLIIGLSFLLGIRVILLLGTGVLGFNGSNPSLVLSVLDQAAITLGIIFIFWMWAFPEPQRFADSTTTFLSLITLLLILIHIFVPSSRNPSPVSRFTWMELVWLGFGLFLLLLGTSLLIQRKPNGWIYGTGMSAVMLSGYILHLNLPDLENDYSGLIRISQMAAYPLLMTIPFRYALAKPAQIKEGEQEKQARRRSSIDLPVLSAILDFSSQLEPKTFHKNIVKLTSYAMVADICLLIEAPDPQGNVNVLQGFDIIRQDYIPHFSVQSNKIPLLSTFIRREQTLHLPASSTSRDLINLSHFLQIRRSGHLLSTPIKLPHSKTPKALVLLSPFSDRQWIKKDQAYLKDLVRLLTSTFEKRKTSPQANLKEIQRSLQEWKAKYEEKKEENKALHEKIIRMEKMIKDQTALADQITSDSYLDKIWQEDDDIEQRKKQLTALATVEDKTKLKAQLKVALREIASLREDLSEAERERIHFQPPPSKDTSLATRNQNLALFAREIREPLDSLVEYSDLLLDQSRNVLNAMQRKMLQRMKMYKEQIDNLVQETLPDQEGTTPWTDAGLHPASFKDAVKQSLQATKEQIQGKDISLTFDIPKTLRPLDMPQDVLNDLILILLANAVQESPTAGAMSIKLRIYKENTEQSFAHIQITDQGEGFSASELPYVIDHQTSETESEQGPSQKIRVDLSSAKDMVENYQGRIWVDNHPNQGKIVSILIPFIPQKRIQEPNTS